MEDREGYVDMGRVMQTAKRAYENDAKQSRAQALSLADLEYRNKVFGDMNSGETHNEEQKVRARAQFALAVVDAINNGTQDEAVTAVMNLMKLAERQPK